MRDPQFRVRMAHAAVRVNEVHEGVCASVLDAISEPREHKTRVLLAHVDGKTRRQDLFQPTCSIVCAKRIQDGRIGLCCSQHQIVLSAHSLAVELAGVECTVAHHSRKRFLEHVDIDARSVIEQPMVRVRIVAHVSLNVKGPNAPSVSPSPESMRRSPGVACRPPTSPTPGPLRSSAAR